MGVCIGDLRKYRSILEASLKRYCPEDEIDVVLGGTPEQNTSIHAAYNDVIQKVRGKGYPALVLIHEDVEIQDEQFCRKVREAAAIDGVGIAGSIGGIGVDRIGWWNATRGKKGYAPDTNGTWYCGFETIDVDVVDGLMLILTPWAVENLRFDETTYSGFHGYDSDICMEAKRRGKRVVVQRFEFKHHCRPVSNYFTPEGLRDFRRSDEAFRKKWGFTRAEPPRAPPPPPRELPRQPAPQPPKQKNSPTPRRTRPKPMMSAKPSPKGHKAAKNSTAVRVARPSREPNAKIFRNNIRRPAR